MPMYWTFNCFLGCIYTVNCIVYIVVLVLNWLSILEFWLPKKEDQVARIGVMGGGGLGNSGNARKKTFFSMDLFPNYTCLCIIRMNSLRSIFPLWSTSTSAMIVFTCSSNYNNWDYLWICKVLLEILVHLWKWSSPQFPWDSNREPSAMLASPSRWETHFHSVGGNFLDFVQSDSCTLSK